jgi:hypothetical protein
VGDEPTVNAIWATLSAKEGRGKKWTSEVHIPIPGRHYPEWVAAQKGVTYRTLRTRLPSGWLDLVMCHPTITVSEDKPEGFRLLTYDEGVPTGFFERLNSSLAIPLKPEWAAWLWQQGQQPHSRLTLQTQTKYEAGQPVAYDRVVETTDTPIVRLNSLGQVACYTVHCTDTYRHCWWQIIRQQLDFGLRMARVKQDCYRLEDWAIQRKDSTWQLAYQGDLLAEAPSLNHLLTEAREKLGLPFMIKEIE